MAGNPYHISPLYVNMEDVRKNYLSELSLTSQFKVSMFLSPGVGGDDLVSYLSKCGLLQGSDPTKYNFMCAEAVLPGSTFDMGEEYGSRQGVIERFPNRRIFSDFNLTFYVDREYNLIRLFEEWMNYIDPIYDDQGIGKASPAGQVRFLDNNSYFRFKYPNTYKKVIGITKFERDMVKEPNTKGSGFKDHTTLTYQFIDAFPTNITALPLSYEGSTITKTTVNFSYSRYIVMRHTGKGDQQFGVGAQQSPSNPDQPSNQQNPILPESKNGGAGTLDYLDRSTNGDYSQYFDSSSVNSGTLGQQVRTSNGIEGA